MPYYNLHTQHLLLLTLHIYESSSQPISGGLEEVRTMCFYFLGIPKNHVAKSSIHQPLMKLALDTNINMHTGAIYLLRQISQINKIS